ncbi:MAG: EscU/YscU/HrcU family type III secretion system export apparatus switch protein [Alphaproteobacteria bacterium]|nr:EscU/YscU/HrcU family type III secretion system export apparatus switch protein [Alphaproteobacteria bacterium]
MNSERELRPRRLPFGAGRGELGRSRSQPGARGSEPEEELAVALEYAPRSDDAPRLVAKGRGELARQIIELAEANGVSVRQDADLATLLEAVEIDQEIPVEAFIAVAEVLAYVYEANNQLSERRREIAERVAADRARTKEAASEPQAMAGDRPAADRDPERDA